ncbi:uncharacterized protein LOC129905810 [Episyrphus balteatus]|uniref:uncharacterized protein LOC129905810 n=1 Tax=Episyrphus balteatus TaxID=286459 RepID=UPI002486BD0C|nr:uncharacterized protein LOC129905810 [Episyrphus balteatus]
MNYERKYLLDTHYVTSKRDFYHYHHHAPKNKAQLKKIIVIFVFICFFSYVFIDFNLKTKINRLKDRFDFSPKVDALPENISQAYFVDTPGCRMPSFNVVDDTILQYMFRIPKFTCNKALIRSVGNEGLALNIEKSEFIELYNITNPEKISCYYQEFERKTDTKNEFAQHRYELNLNDNQVIKVISNAEFVKVVCQYNDAKPFYKDFHFFAVPKGVEKPTTTTINSFELDESSKNHRTSSNPTHAEKKISVMVIGIDSVSRLNFLRQMNRTAGMVRDALNSVEFIGYNKIGDNTYPNLVPALSGLEESELNLACLAPIHGRNVSYDNCPFIWKKYKEAGFKTVFAEDVANLGLFNYFRTGFTEQPTDYYLRPVLIEMEKYIAYKKKANMRLCLGGRRAVDVVLEFIKKLIPFFKRDMFFSFFWMASLTHDFFNMPYLLDEDIVELFDELRMSGVMDRTIVFLMSDHGLRWGSFRKTYQGMMEERQPLLVSIFPDWFAQRYPLAVTNLRDNAKKLTTHYDLHATFLDLLDLSSLETNMLELRASELKEADTIPRGISLFLPVPVTRTCENAGIASHWCTCHQKQTLLTNDGRVQRAARYIVKLINDKLKPYPQCRMLYLNSIAEAIIGASNQKILKEVTTDYLIDITVRVQTKPGLGEFESTVRMSSYTTHLTGTISRINMYGSQSYCIDDYTLKMFCYCHR